MPESEFLSLKQLLDEYFSRLESSKEKDPRKNQLLIEIKQKLAVAGTGQNKIEAYEKYMPLAFLDYWKEVFFDKFFDEYTEQFQSRLEASTDKEKLFEIEIKSLEIYDLSDTPLTGDIKVDGQKLGFALAVNGDNPILSSLIHHITKYEFGVELHLIDNRDDFFDEEYWDLVLKSYQEIFRKLHWVCIGYLNAKKINYIKTTSLQYSNKEMGSKLEQKNEPEKLSNKQQILLVHKLGILDLPTIKNLTTQNQGKLFAKLFGRNEKNTEDYIRYRNGKNVQKKFSLTLPEVQKGVADLLKELGLE
jgi:hypothetical protein